MTERKNYTKEFKLDAISLVLDQGYTRKDAAAHLDVAHVMLGRWIREHQKDDDGQAFRGKGKLTPDQLELRQLREQVKQLEMEREILKKATVFFAKETK